MTYTAIHISYPNWENESPHYQTREEAEAWLKREKSHPKDWGYVREHEEGAAA